MRRDAHPLSAGACSAGIAAGFVVRVVASLLGVAGGEFLIPTLVLLFGADIKLPGSLSLAVSLPTTGWLYALYRNVTGSHSLYGVHRGPRAHIGKAI
jgi:uncharacterized membrane protein YfcA